MKVLAQGQTNLGTIGGAGLGPFANGLTSPLGSILNLVSSIVGVLTIFASIWFLFQILYAGYEWISAGGDAKKIGSARDRITHAFIGLLIVVGSWSLLALTGQFLGYDTLVDPAVFDNLPLQ